MSEAEKQWRQMRDEYLRQIEAELTAVHHPRKKEVLEDVAAHLDRRFAELSQSQQTAENFKTILEDMGPAEEYAEFLKENTSTIHSKIQTETGTWVFLNHVLTLLFVVVFIGVIIYVFSGRAFVQAPDTAKIRGVCENFQPDTEKIHQVMENFQPDPELVGRWTSVDFVTRPEGFVPGRKNWRGDLYLKELVFYDDGRTEGPWLWTQGIIYHPGDNTEAKYFIKTIEEDQYLFFEWMSGDVTIRGMKPKYYVLKKER